MFVSRFMPCLDCGESLDRTRPVLHQCAPDRRVEFAMFGLRGEIARFDATYAAYLATPRGGFAQWLAHRQVRESR